MHLMKKEWKCNSWNKKCKKCKLKTYIQIQLLNSNRCSNKKSNSSRIRNSKFSRFSQKEGIQAEISQWIDREIKILTLLDSQG